MRIYILLICLTIFNTGYAQKNKEFKIESSYILFNQSEKITSEKIKIDFDVYTIRFYNNDRQILFVLRKYSKDQNKYLDKGYMFLFDPNSQSIIWSRKMNNFNLHFSKDRIYFDEDNNTICVSAINGEELWKDGGGNFRLLIDSFNIAITSKGKFIDLETGKEKWTKGINSESGIEDFCLADSNTLLLSAEGLYWIDRLKGPILYQPAETGFTSQSGIMTNSFLLLLGATAGAAGGVYVNPPTVKPNFLFGISSNILTDENSIYSASRKKINVYTYSGTPKWEIEFNDGEKGSSLLFKNNHDLVFIDKGYAYSDIGLRIISDPSLKIINSLNGEIKTTLSLRLEKEAIIDFSLSENKLTLLSNKHLIIINLDGGIILNRLTLPESGIISAKSLINKDQLFLLDASNNRIVNAESLGNQNLYIKGITKMVLSTLINGMNQQLITPENIFEKTDTFNNLEFYSGKDFSLVCNKNGAIIKKIVLSGWWFATEDFDFYVSYNCIQAVRKEDLFYIK